VNKNQKFALATGCAVFVLSLFFVPYKFDATLPATESFASLDNRPGYSLIDGYRRPAPEKGSVSVEEALAFSGISQTPPYTAQSVEQTVRTISGRDDIWNNAGITNIPALLIDWVTIGVLTGAAMLLLGKTKDR